MGKEVAFYLLPSVAGTLVSVLVRLLLITVTDGAPVLLYEKYPALYLIIPMTALVLLGAVVFSFRIYQDMAALQEERAEKIVLENQITQMQSSMVEMEHLYDGIRSVKHDMKNHMAVLQNLIQKKVQRGRMRKSGSILRGCASQWSRLTAGCIRGMPSAMRWWAASSVMRQKR